MILQKHFLGEDVRPDNIVQLEIMNLRQTNRTRGVTFTNYQNLLNGFLQQMIDVQLQTVDTYISCFIVSLLVILLSFPPQMRKQTLLLFFC